MQLLASEYTDFQWLDFKHTQQMSSLKVLESLAVDNLNTQIHMSYTEWGQSGKGKDSLIMAGQFLFWKF